MEHTSNDSHYHVVVNSDVLYTVSYKIAQDSFPSFFLRPSDTSVCHFNHMLGRFLNIASQVS